MNQFTLETKRIFLFRFFLSMYRVQRRSTTLECYFKKYIKLFQVIEHEYLCPSLLARLEFSISLYVRSRESVF